MSSLKKALTALNPRSSSKSREASAANSDTESPRRSGSFLSAGFGRSSTDGGRRSIDHTGATSPRRTSKDGGHRIAHSPLGLLRRKLRSGSDSEHSSTEDLPLNRDGEPMSKNQQRKHERQAEREAQRQEVKSRVEAEQKRKEDMEKRAAEMETPEQRARYGILPVNNYAGEPKNIQRADIRELKPTQVGEEVIFRTRIHNLRKLSAHLMFLELRQQTATIQAIPGLPPGIAF